MRGEFFDGWKLSDSDLLRESVGEQFFEPVDVEAAAERAMDELDIAVPDEEGYAVPLFDRDDPISTDEYVIYKPSRGHIKWFDPSFGFGGVERNADCEQLDDSIIGHRLRFWLDSDLEAETDFDESLLPPTKISPTDYLSTGEQSQFFTALKDFVKSERRAQKEGNWEQYNEMDLSTAIRRGRVSGPFTHLNTFTKDGKLTFKLQYAPDDEDVDSQREVNLRSEEDIFAENSYIADFEGGGEEFPAEVEVTDVSNSLIMVQPAWDNVSNRKAIINKIENTEEPLWLHDLLNPVPFNRRLKAIKQVNQTDDKRDLLTGSRQTRYSANKYTLPESELELNEYQRTALIWADSAEDIFCVHGPPGTGKTRTLTAYVQYAVNQGKTVLVTAHSNQAVDNLIAGDSTPDAPEEGTLHAMAQDDQNSISICRVGSNSRNEVVQTEYLGVSAGNADVIAATTSGAAQFHQDRFDVAVVDEATQASRPATAIVLNTAEKLILAGDHKQLPPYCADETQKNEDMHISLFEYLLNRYDEQISVLLQKQYRMNAEIASFSNQSFYDGKLETADTNHDWTVSDLKPFMGVDIRGPESRPNYGHSYLNKEEAEAAAAQVRLLCQNGLDAENIGVISMYSGQIGEIKSQINQLEIENSRAVTVDTVDSFQGGEREAIIVSFVRSNNDGHSGFLEFPHEGPRRLNVALTRARKRLVLIGDWGTLTTQVSHRSAEESCANVYQQLAEHIRSKDRMLSKNT